jgi:hypothetical protein
VDRPDLDEVFRNLAANRADLDPTKLERTRTLMNRATRDCLVTGYESLIGSLTLPDPDDRHVLAAAIKARAQVIVTRNLADFPADVLNAWDMEAKSPGGCAECVPKFRGDHCWCRDDLQGWISGNRQSRRIEGPLSWAGSRCRRFRRKLR